MPKVIKLERISENPLGIRYAMWADVPAARQTFYANSNARSEWKGINPAQLTALQSGAVVERVEAKAWPAGTAKAVINAALEQAFVAFQEEILGKNDWGDYGSSWDGATWTDTGVA